MIDPQTVECRVELINAHQVLLLVQARRSHVVEVFRRVPQQSDYLSEWQSRASTVQGRTKWEIAVMGFGMPKRRNRFGGRLTNFAVRQLLRPVYFYRRRQLAFRRSLRNTNFFFPINRQM